MNFKHTNKIACSLLLLFLGTVSLTAQDKLKNLVELTPEIADNICIRMVTLSNEQIPPQKAIKKLLVYNKVISKNATKKEIGTFINKNLKRLNCKASKIDSTIKAQHLYQRFFDGNVTSFFYDVVLEEEYEIDFNAKFTHNGKELNLLDHINYILNTPHEIRKYDESTLSDIRDGIIEMNAVTGDKS
jgi:hypothetical protein